MKILVTGAQGQLGSELRDLAPAHEMVYTDQAELDLLDFAAVDSFLDQQVINAVINCAAYTAVDKAEEDQELAEKVNHLSVAHLAQAAKQRDIFLLHISTDYVFDGQSHWPYREDDQTAPASVYGRTKLAGEEAIRRLGGPAVIVRTAWLYSTHGQNFVKTITQLLREKPQLSVVFDQVGNPTYARDLAQALLAIINGPKPAGVETYHYGNEGVASWYDFAQAIAELTGASCEILPVDTSAFPRPAPRPAYSVFEKTKIKRDYGLTIPYWRDSLKDCLRKMP